MSPTKKLYKMYCSSIDWFEIPEWPLTTGHLVLPESRIGCRASTLTVTYSLLKYTVKKRFASFPSPAGMSLPNSPWAGIMTSLLNYSCPGRVWLVTSQLETGNSWTFFYGVGEVYLICSVNEGPVIKFEDLFLFARHFLFLHKLIWCGGEKIIWDLVTAS
jgi:hypothetical protein